MRVAHARMASAAPRISSSVSPFMRNATAKPPTWACVASPASIRPMTAAISSRVRSCRLTTRLNASLMVMALFPPRHVTVDDTQHGSRFSTRTRSAQDTSKAQGVRFLLYSSLSLTGLFRGIKIGRRFWFSRRSEAWRNRTSSWWGPDWRGSRAPGCCTGQRGRGGGWKGAAGGGGGVGTDAVDGFLLDRGFQVLLTAYPEPPQWLDYPALDLKPFFPGALVWRGGGGHPLPPPTPPPPPP